MIFTRGEESAFDKEALNWRGTRVRRSATFCSRLWASMVVFNEFIVKNNNLYYCLIQQVF